jgi:TonB family protein
MTTTLPGYLLHATLLWGLFALLYHSVLRRETFFALNRAYLLFALLAGALLPLAGSMIPQAGFPVVTLPVVDLTAAAANTANAPDTGAAAYGLRLLYLAGVAFGALRLGIGLVRIAALVSRSEREKASDGSILVHTGRVNMPFSFFHFIIVPRQFTADPALLRTMLAHERAHVHERHSLDVLLFEAFAVVFWFHPLVYYFRRQMRNVHEFQADAAASGETGARQYGYWLLEQAGKPSAQLVLANHFYQSPLRQRLVMMTRRPSGPLRRLKYLLFFPLVLGGLIQTGAETPSEAVAVEAAFPGGIPALMTYLAENIVYPEEAKKAGLEALVVLELTIDANGKVTSVKHLTSDKSPAPHPDMVAEAQRVAHAMPAWEPALVNGKPTASKMTLPIRFRLQ